MSFKIHFKSTQTQMNCNDLKNFYISGFKQCGISNVSNRVLTSRCPIKHCISKHGYSQEIRNLKNRSETASIHNR